MTVPAPHPGQPPFINCSSCESVSEWGAIECSVCGAPIARDQYEKHRADWLAVKATIQTIATHNLMLEQMQKEHKQRIRLGRIKDASTKLHGFAKSAMNSINEGANRMFGSATPQEALRQDRKQAIYLQLVVGLGLLLPSATFYYRSRSGHPEDWDVGGWFAIGLGAVFLLLSLFNYLTRNSD